ncbi:SusE domain-containing protein [Mucilaginibacter sp. Mucisp86]|uniref:SusE domain-containing protein n=1 Tax=Mucilaginibacter sp. Mucisp86 TaxID=3243060 RepID=UPI0039B67AE7
MKNITYCLMAGIITILMVTGCKKDKTLQHTQVSAVNNLFAPANNKFIQLEPVTGSATFEWAEAHAEDNGLVLYEVAFDKESGDFSKPIYTIPSDANGLYNKLTISYKDLNKVADLAGIQPQATGKLKWTVMSSKGINVVKATVSSIIEVQRAAGFTDIPADLYLTGSATEGGEDLSKAVHFKQTAAGVFEAWTSLKAGTYHFAERNTGTPATYSIDGVKLLKDGNTTVTGATKVERIVVDFTSASAAITEVTEVGLWFAADNKVWFPIPYKAGGKWEIDNASIVFHQESWGRDERYKFRFTFKDAAGNSSIQFYGSKNSDNSRPDANTAKSFWYMVPVNNSQYDFCFKFTGAADNHNADIVVDFSADAAAYTHSVTVK